MSAEAIPQEVERLADHVVRFGLSVPMIFFLESMRPMNNVGAYTLHFLSPVVTPMMPGLGVQQLAQFLEKRDSIELLIRAIEEREAQQ